MGTGTVQFSKLHHLIRKRTTVHNQQRPLVSALFLSILLASNVFPFFFLASPVLAVRGLILVSCN